MGVYEFPIDEVKIGESRTSFPQRRNLHLPIANPPIQCQEKGMYQLFIRTAEFCLLSTRTVW
jgi:hypothetical protein